LTLVSSIITQAYRETNITTIGVSPTAAEQSEALGLLNNIVLSSVGNEIGDELRDLNIGGDYDETDYTLSWVPFNARLVLNLEEATTLYLNPQPYTGQRVAFTDAAGNLATYNLIINANGRKIEDAATLTLSTDDEAREWLYRGDTGNWVRILPLITTDSMPLPSDFDDYFISALAIRLNSRNSAATSQETLEVFKRGRRNIRARYRNRAETYPEYVGVLGQDRRTTSDGTEFGRGGW